MTVLYDHGDEGDWVERLREENRQLKAQLDAAREVVGASRPFAGPVGDGWHDEECTPDYGPDEPEECYESCPNPRLTAALAAYDRAVEEGGAR
jgi:hypothetical protein